ncbi:MAG: phosphopentomutase [Eubacteriales bacterium]
MKRVFLIVLDSFGVGELPDAAKFGDVGANTLRSVAKSQYFNIPNLIKSGLGNIDGVDCIEKSDTPCAAFGKCAELSAGKDTTVGHWEIAGVVSEKKFPTFPNGFPEELIREFSKETGRGVLCNKPYSGTEVIKDYGDEHIKTGKLIVYTSQDSVFQIAAHEDVVPVDELYHYCRIARKLLTGPLGVGRVIARPFEGEYPFKRTANRHDFSIEPTGKTVLDAICENSLSSISVGKIYDIFAKRGITEYCLSHSNTEGMELTLQILDKDFCGLCFTNLVDFDMVYGHRNDGDGYAKALSEFDGWLPSFIDRMRDDDILIVTADHGCDPGDISTDHTREYIPLLVYGKKVLPVNLGVRTTYSDIAATIADYLKINYTCRGKSFLDKIIRA